MSGSPLDTIRFIKGQICYIYDYITFLLPIQPQIIGKTERLR